MCGVPTNCPDSQGKYNPLDALLSALGVALRVLEAFATQVDGYLFDFSPPLLKPIHFTFFFFFKELTAERKKLTRGNVLPPLTGLTVLAVVVRNIRVYVFPPEKGPQEKEGGISIYFNREGKKKKKKGKKL